MGCAFFASQSNAFLQRHIRKISQSTGSVFITQHARLRMRQRAIGIAEVFETLRFGVIERPPIVNAKKGNLECRLQRYVGGRECAVVIALSDDEPDLIVVTVMNIAIRESD